MVHRHDAFGHRAARPVLEVFQIADARGGEMDSRPADALGRALFEPRRVAADRPAVVVSSNRSDMSLTQDLEHLVRPWIVADEVARHPDSVRRDAIDVREDSLEGGEIRVDVGKDREAHPPTERSRAISGSQYGARTMRQSGHRDEANQLHLEIVVADRRPMEAEKVLRWVPLDAGRTGFSRRGNPPPSPSRSGDNSSSQ